MLAHLKKAKHREYAIAAAANGSSTHHNPSVEKPAQAAAPQDSTTVSKSQSPPNNMTTKPVEDPYVPTTADDEKSATQISCDVLCSLGSSYPASADVGNPYEEDIMCADSTEESMSYNSGEKRKSKGSSSCKQPTGHQLPMFLSKTYHMIDRCDQSIATWSLAGDNFVVKNVEKFASHVLPLYFKHSNFSSFARQLNFYGFRKLRTDPILTSDVDPRTACYVRFYHEKFQKDRPELLHQIKRATKSDQQSKDDVESLKSEVSKLKDCIGHMSADMDRKLAEMSYEYNRRISNMNNEYDKLAALVHQIVAHQQQHTHNQHVQQHPQQDPSTTAATPTAIKSPTQGPSSRVPDLMQSLSQVAAMSLQNQLRPPSSSAAAAAEGPAAATHSTNESSASAGTKRNAPEEPDLTSSRARTD